MHFTFFYPYALLLLLLLPCFIWCKERVKIRYFSKVEWLPKQSFIWDNLLVWIMIIYTLLVIALAMPFSYDTEENSARKGRDLVLILDTSGSMGERGFSKENSERSKYEISVILAKDFIEKRYDDNIGLVVFGTYAFTASPLTYDLEALKEMFDLMSSVGIAGTSTAIGDALMQGIETLTSGKANSKVLILLTDGQHNSGEKSPHEAVAEAVRLGIKIYTIGIGKKSDYDVALLSQIAKETEAKSFSAQYAEELKEVYTEIAQLEPSAIRSEQYMNQKMLFFYPLLLATILLTFLLFRDEVGL